MSKKIKYAVAATIIVALAVFGYFFSERHGLFDQNIQNTPTSFPVVVNGRGSDLVHANPSQIADVQSPGRFSGLVRGASISDPFRLVNEGETIDSALKQAIAANGLSDPRAASLYYMATLTCGSEPDPYSSIDQTHPDKTRIWAIDRLTAMCEGFDADAYSFENADPGLADLIRTAGSQRAAEESLKALKTAADYHTLFEAGQVLLETKQFPLSVVLPEADQDYGAPELMRAWSMASNLMVCRESGGCGPNSLSTASFCANVGCRSDVDLALAFRQELPPKEYQAVMAFYLWLSSQRK